MQVKIEPIEPRHALDTWEYRNDPSLWKWMKCDTPLPASLAGDCEYYIRAMQTGGWWMFAIIVDGRAVGCCQLYNVANGAGEMRYYVLDKTLWGKGVCTEATNQLIDYGFDVLDLDLIYRYIDTRNVGSMRVAEKQKFAKIGISFINPKVVRLEMTKTGWQRQRKSRKTKTM